MDPDGAYMERFASALRVMALPVSVLLVDDRVTAVHIGAFRDRADLDSRVPR
jgi:hypothetical protein